jgi:hypothetical protein
MFNNQHIRISSGGSTTSTNSTQLKGTTAPPIDFANKQQHPIVNNSAPNQVNTDLNLFNSIRTHNFISNCYIDDLY